MAIRHVDECASFVDSNTFIDAIKSALNPIPDPISITTRSLPFSLCPSTFASPTKILIRNQIEMHFNAEPYILYLISGVGRSTNNILVFR